MIDAPLGDRSQWKPKWPELGIYEVPIGKAKVVREGTDATLVSFGRTLPLCTKLADEMKSDGKSIEVIDLRSLYPYDWQCIKASVLKTKRVMFVNEDTEITNFGEHLANRVTRELFYHIHAAPRVLAGRNVPGIGLHPNLEDASIPQMPELTAETLALLAEQP